MNATQAKNKQGFTIIEVVLVLAIAALIFLMVFIALPALQRNQRDTARKTVLGKVASAVTSYQSNNRGKNPTSADYAKLAGYLDGTSTANGVETGQEYIVQVYAFGPSPGKPTGTEAPKFNVEINNLQQVWIVTAAKCDTTGTAISDGNTREAAVLIGLENGEASLCQNV